MAIKPSALYQLSYGDQALWERGDLSLAGIRRAWSERRDPRLAEYIVKLVQLDPALSEEEEKAVEGKYSYLQLLDSLRPWTFSRALDQRCNALGVSLRPGEMKREQIREVIAGMHRELWTQVEANPEVMTDRLKLGELLLEMWSTSDAFSRDTLLKVMAECPLKYGPWRAMKRIFKESVSRQDWVMFGVIAARLDREGNRLGKGTNRRGPNRPFSVPYAHDNRDVSKATVNYLLRRAWRTLRELAKDQPRLYPDVAVQVLKHYQRGDSVWELTNAWLRNHILFHDTKRYRAESFNHYPRTPYYGKQAYSELWKQSEGPLLRLLEEAENELVIHFVSEALTTDFKPKLEKLSAAWVGRIAQLNHSDKDGFLHQWFTEMCTHPQAQYEQEGLHEPLLALLWSSNHKMSQYALGYFQAHPSALISLLSIDRAMALVRSSRSDLRQLGESLLDPSAGHFTLSFEQWTSLVTEASSFHFGAKHFVKLFSGKDLTYSWYTEMINHELSQVSDWAMKLLNDSAFTPTGGDLFDFYWSLLTPSEWRPASAKAALDGLAADREEGPLLAQLSSAQLMALLLHPSGTGRKRLEQWAKQDLVSVSSLGATWLRCVLNRDSWREGAWHSAMLHEGEEWREGLSYSDEVAELCRGWLLNKKYFKSEEIGAWWLLQQGLTSDWSARAYREYLKNTLPLSHFVALNFDDEERGDQAIEQKPSAQEGLNSLLDRLSSKKAGDDERWALREIFVSRVNAFVKMGNPNAQSLPKAIGVSDGMVSFEIYSRLAWSLDERDRVIATRLGECFYRQWTEQTPLSFDELLPFFERGFSDIQDHLLRAMSAHPLSAEARIDVRLEQFDPNGLYSFCFSSKAKVRDLGLSLIGEHPERFAHPERIALLVESSDRRVCEGVVNLLWTKLRHRAVTAPWAPHAQSISPRSAVAQQQVEMVSAQPPSGKRPTEIKGRRYLGEGTHVEQSLPTESLTWVSDFLSRTLFRLSPTHPTKDNLGRLTSATPSWRNKVNLIKAIRDLAVKDMDFAALVKPILEEFMSTRGQSERAACLVALTRMRVAHPQLFATSA